jgi:general secretion pathway protein A
MYEAYWRLTEKPFEQGVDPQFFFAGESHQAALLKLRYAIENRRGGALLTGISGVGKTLVVRMLRQLAPESLRPFVHITFPQMSTAELLAYLADELTGDDTPGMPSTAESLRRIERFLAENTRKGRHAIVVVDEAHLVDQPASLETLRLLMNFETDAQPGLTLLLTGQTGLLPTLQRTPQLDERLAVKCMLRPFTPKETSDYVNHRLQVAGAKRAIVPHEAMATLHSLTRGVARQINRLCDLALLIGYAEERQTLSASQFESVADELVSIAPE